MGQGYTRNDSGNNIADGNIVNASDLDGEFDAIVAAFHASTGHTHDGTSAEGAPIEKLGPAQDLVVSITEVSPKTTNTLDLGTASLQFKDLYIDGVGYLDSVDIDGGNIDGTIIGSASAAAATFTDLTATGTINLSGSMTVTDNVFYIADQTDATKKIQFEASGITTATTRTLTVPDVSDTLVTLAATQTLTNKTLTTPVIDLSAITSAGDLAVSDGGTGASTAADARTNLGVDAAGTDNSTNVTLAGSGTYISIAGQVITVDPITESDISDLGSYLTDITGEALSTLSDVTITTIASGEILKWNGTAWINNTLAEAGIAASSHSHAASDITSGTLVHEQGGLEADVSAYSGLVKISGGATSAVTDNSTNWDTAYSWGDHSSAGYLTGITGEALSSLSDVTITTIASGEILKWNGTAWINNTLAEAGIAATSHTHATSDVTSGTFADARIAQSNVTQHQAALSITESQISDLGTYLTGITGEPLSDLSDVTITTIASGEILKWNGTAWINNTLAEAGIAAASHTHVEADITDLQSYLLDITGENLSTLADVTITSIASGEILKWNGSAWINNTLAEAGIQAQGDVLDDLNTLGAATTDGQFIVATGAGAFAYESGATARTSLGLTIGTDVQAYDADILKADTHDTLTAGYDSDAEALTLSGTVTPEVDSDTEENFKTGTNNGAFTLAAPSTSSNCVILIQVTNGASAGTITFSGYTLQDGDDLTTTNGDDFIIRIVKIGSFTWANVKALQ